jgi:ribonuclease D
MTITMYKGDLPKNLDFGDSVAIDTETLGLIPERDPLCLIQLSSGDGTAHLLQFDRSNYDAPNLKKILSDPNCEKIFHFARFDVAVIKHYLDIDCAPIYCTKIASKLARTYTDKHGLKDICKELLGIELSKNEQTSDWSLEELSEEQKKLMQPLMFYIYIN